MPKSLENAISQLRAAPLSITIGRMKKEMPLFLYRLIQFTWGLPQTAAGLCLYLYFYKNKHFKYRNAIITVWSDGADCLSLGPFVFISGSFFEKDPRTGARIVPEGSILTEPVDELGSTVSTVHTAGSGLRTDVEDRFEMSPALERILRHEYGHSIQSMILGPAYLPVVGIPSILWCRVPPLGRSWRSGKRSYYSFFTERSADRFGGNKRE